MSAVAAVRDNWQFLAAIVVALWTVGVFLVNRQREAAWKRTEFMFTQLRFLDTDPAGAEAIAILQATAELARRDKWDEQSDAVNPFAGASAGTQS